MADQHGNNSQNVKEILGLASPIQQGGGGGDGSGGSSSNDRGASHYASSNSGSAAPPFATNVQSDTSPPQHTHRATTPTSTSKQDPTQKDRASGLCYKDREERVRQLRERQQTERHQKLEELKEQAAAAHRFREQQEAARRQRLDEMRSKDSERRTQVEERKRIIQQAEQERREAVLRKSAEREQRYEHKRRQERSNAVFAFGSSTPRMLDPKENIAIQNYWGARRATSTTNVNLSDSSSAIRRASECQESDLSRKRATSAHSLNRKPDDLRMSTSMYEVFNWDDGNLPPAKVPLEPHPSSQGTRLAKSRDSSLERRSIPLKGLISNPEVPPMKPVSSLASSSSSNSSEKTLVSPAQNGSRFSVWEFGDNFAALGLKVGSGNQPTATPSSSSTSPLTNPPHFSTSHYDTPSSTPHFSRRTSSVMTGAGCTLGDDPMTQSLVATPSTAARRRTDLMPSVPSLRDNTTRGSPRHRSPGMTHSLSRLDQLAKPRQQRPNSLAPLHEFPPGAKSMTPARTISKSMSHLGPQKACAPISSTTDGVGVPVTDGSLDRRSSRSSLALAHPRMTRAELLKLKLRGVSRNLDGFRSGTGTPNSPSRPTSALSQASGGSQVVLRNRTSPKKPRPLSIAGSIPSSADKPRDLSLSTSPASPNRESRSIERKTSSTVNGPIKLTRAKSASSDRSAPSTPAKTPSRGTTPKRTPAQVKAESAARKAAEKSKIAPKLKSTPKTTPLQSPSVESKSLPNSEKKTTGKTITKEVTKPPSKESSSNDLKENTSPSLGNEVLEASNKEPTNSESNDLAATGNQGDNVSSLITTEETEIKVESISNEVQEISVETITTVPDYDVPTVKTSEAEVVCSESKTEPSENATTTEEEEEKTLVQRASDKPVTGYATEEEYKAALAEKRREAREAKERELELERQRQLEEEERERKEEEDYLRLMEEQKKVEEERLKKAIEEAEKQRQEEAIKKEEEEKQRVETERIEQEKRLQAEEKARKEEEERLMRKSRVAQIMSRTRGSKGGNTPLKTEVKSPSDDRNLNESLTGASLTESFISSISSSMTDSMIVQAIESRESSQEKTSLESTEVAVVDSASDCSSQPLSDLSNQPLSDVSSQAPNSVELNFSQSSSDVQSESNSVQSSIQITQESLVVTPQNSDQESRSIPVELDGDFVSPVTIENTFHLNGNSPITMETTPTMQNVDLLGSFNGVNGINYNGVERQTRTDNEFGSLDPLNSPSSVSFSTKMDSNFDQIIDLNQTKLSNEDAVNSNNPPTPFIAFEENLNKKQSQDSSNVPDLLL